MALPGVLTMQQGPAGATSANTEYITYSECQPD